MPMTAAQRDLLRRLEAFDIDGDSPTLSFPLRLARENGWTPAFAERVVTEYKRFLLLAATAAHPVTPSDQVDQAWHLHLAYTDSYWNRLCAQVLGRALHHNPTRGGDSENAKFDEWYDRTLVLYERTFDHPPPRDIWPPASVRFGDDLHYARVNTRRCRVVPRGGWFAQAAAAAFWTALGAAVVASIPLLITQAPPARIVLAAAAAAAVLFLLIYIIAAAARARQNASGSSAGGGGCGGGGGFFGWGGGCGGSGCGSSGCGGGGGCGGGCGGG